MLLFRRGFLKSLLALVPLSLPWPLRAHTKAKPQGGSVQVARLDGPASLHRLYVGANGPTTFQLVWQTGSVLYEVRQTNSYLHAWDPGWDNRANVLEGESIFLVAKPDRPGFYLTGILVDGDGRLHGSGTWPFPLP